MNYRTFMYAVLLPALSLVLAGCSVKDPSARDLKSPCAATSLRDVATNYDTGPCVKRSPGLNSYFV